MDREEFEQLGRGDIVRNLGDHTSYVIKGPAPTFGNGPAFIGVETCHITNPAEWERVPSQREAEAMAKAAVEMIKPPLPAGVKDTPELRNRAQRDLNELQRRENIEMALASGRDLLTLDDLAAIWGVTKPRMVVKLGEVPGVPEPIIETGARVSYPAAPTLKALLDYLAAPGAKVGENFEAAVDRAFDRMRKTAPEVSPPDFGEQPAHGADDAIRESIRDTIENGVLKSMPKFIVDTAPLDARSVKMSGGPYDNVYTVVPVGVLAICLPDPQGGPLLNYQRSLVTPEYFVYQP